MDRADELTVAPTGPTLARTSWLSTRRRPCLTCEALLPDAGATAKREWAKGTRDQADGSRIGEEHASLESNVQSYVAIALIAQIILDGRVGAASMVEQEQLR